LKKLVRRVTTFAAAMAVAVLAGGVSAPGPAAASIPTEYVNYLRVLDTNNCLAYNDTRVFVARCGSAGTKWIFDDVTTSEFRLQTYEGFRCLEPGSASIYLLNCDVDRSAQRWAIIGYGDRNWAPISNYAGRYLNYDYAGGVFMTSGQGVALTDWEWVAADGLGLRGPETPQANLVGTAVSPVKHTVYNGKNAYSWSATGMPPGLSIDDETGTISGTPTTAGSFTVQVTATEYRDLPRSGSMSYRWTVLPVPAPGCSDTNGTDVAIPDGGAIVPAESYIGVTGCAGNISAAATVEVHIKHTRIGNLTVSIVTPSGRLHFLQQQAGGWDQDIDKTYAMKLSAPQVGDGVWRLRVKDEVTDGYSGLIDSWTIKL
jgi:hypothetical protein